MDVEEHKTENKAYPEEELNGHKFYYVQHTLFYVVIFLLFEHGEKKLRMMILPHKIKELCSIEDLQNS